jgi:PKHD-type hydroxylase
MILCIADVLSAEEVASLVTSLSKANFEDGKLTAGWHAKLVKNNEQVQSGGAGDAAGQAATMQSLVLSALKRHALFQMAVLPKVVRAPLLSRYLPGMAYGTHVDNAVMAVNQDISTDKSQDNSPSQMRADVSLTLFLSDPDTYTGGELVIESTQGEQSFKLPAGAMVLYPSSTLHRVEPVSKGVRYAAVSWVQSLVQDPAKREVLFDLATAHQLLFDTYGKTKEFDLIAKTQSNLLRRWVAL